MNNVADAPARLFAFPNFAMPTSVYFLGALVVRTVTTSPTLRLPFEALFLSMTI